MEDSFFINFFRGPQAGVGEPALEERPPSWAAARKSARRKRFEPLTTLRLLLILVRMAPLALLLVRRLWLSIISAFDTLDLRRATKDSHGQDEHLLGAPFEGAPFFASMNRTPNARRPLSTSLPFNSRSQQLSPTASSSWQDR